MMMKFDKYESYEIYLISFCAIMQVIASSNITDGDSTVVNILSPQRMWDPEKNAIIGLTENPQQMWDPEKGSIFGRNITTPLNNSNATVTNKTVQVGSSTFLDCHVRNMADKKVSWIRRRDNHILTSGILTYTNDERFSVVRAEGSDNWALLIRYVQERDMGRYECQVSTKTGRYGYNIDLHVVLPKATIVGSSELHVQSGSTISLLCIINDVLTPPHFILWYHNSKAIYNSQIRRGMTIETELQPNATSRLTIRGAAYHESGNYTCIATDSKQASVNVFISEGDKTAAIHRFGSGGLSLMIDQSVSGSLFLCIFLLYSNQLFTFSNHFLIDQIATLVHT